MKKAFTITELLLAISLMVVLIVTSGVVFRTAVKAHRTASATAEIARKLRGVTDQLNADFKGLRKDGEIFIAWVPNGVDGDGNGTIDRYERLDRIMFFADGDFQSYKEWSPVGVIHGNVARISYILAKDKNGNRAQLQAPGDRVLARSQHIFAADPALVDMPERPRTRPINLVPLIFTEWGNNYYEYDNLLLDEWLNISWVDKREMLTIITDILVDTPTVAGGGLTIDTAPEPNIYQLLCEGVGDFSIQGWYVPSGSPPRWFPSVDPDGNGDLIDTDFTVNAGDTRLLDMSVAPPRLVYPWPWDLDPLDPAHDPVNDTVVDFGGRDNYPRRMIDRDNFDRIPGLGRALKFTFTLYDSRGVFKEGKKFTHIVYLDE